MLSVKFDFEVQIRVPTLQYQQNAYWEYGGKIVSIFALVST